MNPKILLVDDEPATLESYEDILSDHGFDTRRALSHEEAIVALETEGPWDVILLDEMLRGSGGSAMATSVLADIAARAPTARTIVITGFATPDLVRTALRAGAWDYLEKDARYLELLLPVRVRHAVEAARERSLRGVATGVIAAELQGAWAAARAPGLDAHRKGRLLEETALLLFRTMKGLDRAEVNLRGDAEEFDIVAPNESDDPILSKEGSFLLVECKNWSRPVDPVALDHFRAKLRDRFRRVQLGILIGVAGFTEGVRNKVASMNNEPQLILLVDGNDLNVWITAADPLAWLKERLRAAVLRGQG